MKKYILLARLRDNGVNCLFNAGRFSEPEIIDLLNLEASKLFAEKEQIYETDNAISYRVIKNEHVYFAKEFKIKKWYRQIWNRLFPICQNNFKAGIRLMKAGLPTPTPLMAAVFTKGNQRKQILITDFCTAAIGLDGFTSHYKHQERLAVMDKVSDLLAEFFSKRFYSRHLRSANILITKENGRHCLWFIDLDLLGSSRFLPKSAFINTVSRASFEFYEHLTTDEKKYWLKSCFNAAIRHNICNDTNKESSFSDRVIAQIKKRNPMIFSNSG
jgi:hypothetical protein